METLSNKITSKELKTPQNIVSKKLSQMQITR